MWFRDEPSGSLWACNASSWWASNIRGWQGRGVVRLLQLLGKTELHRDERDFEVVQVKQYGVLQVVSEHIYHSMMWFEDEPSGRWWACNTSAWCACNTRGWQRRGVQVWDCMVEGRLIRMICHYLYQQDASSFR